MKDQAMKCKEILARTIDAWNRGFCRAYGILRPLDRLSINSYYWGKWEVARMEAVIACREDFPALAAALWGSAAYLATDILYEVQALIDDDVPVWTIRTESDFDILEELAEERYWCQTWKRHARPALCQYLEPFSS